MESLGLSIGYNGIFLANSSKEKCSEIGVVLTRGGKVFVRDSKHDSWDDVETPLVFFFRDNKSETSYLVDKNKKSISEANPHGRVLDCTDQMIYEVVHHEWKPICDFSTKVTRTVVRCSHLPAVQVTGPVSSRQVSACLLNNILEEGKCEPITVSSLPGCELTVPIDVLGCDAVVLCEFSEIDADMVDLCNGFMSADAVAPGECAVLIYEACVCGEKVIVAHIFIREAVVPRFSVKCGQFVPPEAPVPAAVATPVPDPLCPDMDPCLVPITSVDGIATNLYQLQDWVTVYQVPAGQFSPAGVWTVPRSGDYTIKAEIYLCSLRRLVLLLDSDGQIDCPYFILVRYPAGADPSVTPGVIEACAPIQNNLGIIGTTTVPPLQDRIESIHCSFDVGLRLTAGEQFVIYYVDDQRLAITRTLPPVSGDPDIGYRTVRCGTTFNANYLGSA